MKLFDTVYVSFYKGLGGLAGVSPVRRRDHGSTRAALA
jgi:hypothetical protein